MILNRVDGIELPCAVRIVGIGLSHMACDDAPANVGGVVVACCGEPLQGHTEAGTPGQDDETCTLCPLIPEGECACWAGEGRTTDRRRLIGHSASGSAVVP